MQFVLTTLSLHLFCLFSQLVCTISTCTHQVLTIEDVCTACHVKLQDTAAYAFYITPSNHPIKRRVSDVETESMAKKQALLASRRLVLVLDLDQTVLHAALLTGYDGPLDAEMDPKQTSTFTFELSDRSRMIVKFRPGLREFLLQAHKLYEIHVYTMANAEYAARIVDLINTKILEDVDLLERSQIIGNRIITRSHTEDSYELRLKAQGGAAYAMKLREKRKDIKHIVGDSSIAVILDDSESVWADYLNHLIQLYPFVYWPHQEDLNKTFHARNAAAQSTASASATTSSNSPLTSASTTAIPISSNDIITASSPPSNGVEKVDENSSAESSKKRRSTSDEPISDLSDDLNVPDAKKSKLIEVDAEQMHKGDGTLQLDSSPSEDANGHSNSGAVVGAPTNPDSSPNTTASSVSDAQPLMDLQSNQPMLQPFGIRHLPANNADNVLESMMAVLTRLHSEFFSLPETSRRRQVQLILPRIRSQVLHGRRISFSGVFPQQIKTQAIKSGQANAKEAAIWNDHVKAAKREVSRIESFGAVFVEEFHPGNPEHVTHLVSARGGTQKARKALMEKDIFVVSKTWLDQSIISWSPQEEKHYNLPDFPLFTGSAPLIPPVPDSIWTEADLELDVPLPVSPHSDIDLGLLLTTDDYFDSD